MKRLIGIAAALGALTGSADAACRAALFPEDPKVFLSEFGNRMARVGAPEWVLASQTAKGPMYISTKTDLTIAVKEQDGLVSEVGLLLSNPTDAETARFEAASAYLAAHFSGANEGAIASDVASKAREMQRSKQQAVYRSGDTVALFQNVDGGYYAAIGNRRCD
jgi:hypothetical protein